MKIRIRDGQNKRAGILDWKYEDIANLGNKVTGGNPLIAAGLTGGAGALAGYALGPKITQLLDSALSRAMPRLAGRPTPMRTKADINKARRRMGLTGAALGTLPWIPYIYDTFKKESSLNSEMAKRARQMSKSGGGNYVSGIGNLVDSNFAKNIIYEDSHIDSNTGNKVRNIFDMAEQKAPRSGKLQGLLTVNDIVRGAVGAGLGYGTASVAGPFLGGLFGMPRGTINKLKRTGGLAGALKGSGIIR